MILLGSNLMVATLAKFGAATCLIPIELSGAAIGGGEEAKFDPLNYA
jgi:hypothetical protein